MASTVKNYQKPKKEKKAKTIVDRFLEAMSKKTESDKRKSNFGTDPLK